MGFFSIKQIAVDLPGYPLSYIELIGTVFGLISVYLATRANIFTWLTGIVNEFFLFLLFCQVQLYPDMLLQLFFFGTTLYGWYHWGRKNNPLAISRLNARNRATLATVITIGTLLSGLLFEYIHLIMPQLFSTPSAYPYADSFVMVTSIFATILLARKKLDSWFLWIIADLVCVIIYLKKGIYFLSMEYLLFLTLAIYGYILWRKLLPHG